MEKLLQLSNFCTKDGKVVTFFNGKLTLSQLIVILIILIVIIFAIKVLKGAVRTIVLVVSLCIGLVHYGIASPTQIKDTASIIAEKGISTYTKIANTSESIRIKGKSIELKIDNNWVDISDITSFIQTENNIATVIIDGNSYIVEDKSIISLLKTFK